MKQGQEKYKIGSNVLKSDTFPLLMVFLSFYPGLKFEKYSIIYQDLD